MVARVGLAVVFAFVIAATVAAIQQGSTIRVIEGQDAAYVAGQGPSTAAIVEVRGANNAPMANVLVTFSIMPANTKLASFANGLMRIGVMTDANGRATATGLLPLGSGPFSIQAAVVADGGTPGPTATLFATNYATAADAIRNNKPSAAPAPAPAPPAAPAAPVAPAAAPQAPAMAANDLGLQIVVLAGEDGVNIIQQKTAVQPLIEVRDKNGLPVGGVLVTFGISGVGGGVSPAAFANGLSRIGVMTDSLGRASAQGLQAITNGAFNIDITASMSGQTVSRTIGQANFQTIADAISAGKGPALAAQNAQATQGAGAQGSQGSQASNSGSQASNSGSQASNSGSQASNAGSQASSAGGSSGGAAGGGAAAGGGGLGGGAIAGIAVAGVGAAGYGAYQAGLLDTIFPKCKAEEDAVTTAANSININSFSNCLNNARTNAQITSCYNTYYGPLNNALGDWCTCSGTKLSDDDRDFFRLYYDELRSSGLNVSGLQRCAQ
jgi:hypothetical protein